MKFDPLKFRNAVLGIVQPVYRASFNGTSGIIAKLKDLAPFGSTDQAQHLSPYGFISKPIAGTYAYFSNLLGNSQAPVILNHLDRSRPTLSADGESMQYSSGGYKFYAKNDRLYVGKGTTFEEVVVGETLRLFLISLIAEINLHTHASSVPGAPTGPPLDATAFTDLQANNLDNKKILAVDGGRF